MPKQRDRFVEGYAPDTEKHGYQPTGQDRNPTPDAGHNPRSTESDKPPPGDE